MRICSRCGKEYFDNKESGLCPDCRSLIGRRAKRKGYTDEKRFEKWMQNQINKYDLPYQIHRSPSSGAIHNFNSSDFFFSHLPSYSWFNKLHIEKKDRANWDIIKWIKEAEEKELEMGTFKKPIIIVKKPNNEDDYVIMKKELFAELILSLDKLLEKNE